ncbi:hypothetical protein ABIB30_000991 [Pedobacter sp. UYP1]
MKPSCAKTNRNEQNRVAQDSFITIKKQTI